jgi:hypothetical protein
MDPGERRRSKGPRIGRVDLRDAAMSHELLVRQQLRLSDNFTGSRAVRDPQRG